jgi:hypothetical protein
MYEYLPLAQEVSGMSVLLMLALLATVQVPSAPIGHWKLDKGIASRIAADATTAALHGRFEELDAGAVAKQQVPGKIGHAVRFSGDGSIRLDRHASLLGKLTDFTISLWIQYDGGPSRQLFTFSDGTMNYRVQVEVHDGRLHFGWQNGGSFAGFGTEKLTWKPGTWYHVVFVNDHQTGKSILRSNDLVWKTDPNTL